MLKFIIPTTFLISFLVSAVHPACSGTPTTSRDCNVQSDSNNYCCYVNAAGTKSCVQVSKTSYLQNQTYSQNSGTYLMDCGYGAGANNLNQININSQFNGSTHTVSLVAGSPCGQLNPVSSMDCRSYSMVNDTCCYYSIGQNTGCAFAGSAYFGNFTRSDGSSVICNASYLLPKIMILFFAISILLI